MSRCSRASSGRTRSGSVYKSSTGDPGWGPAPPVPPSTIILAASALRRGRVINRCTCVFQAKLKAVKAQGNFKACKELKVALDIEINCKARRRRRGCHARTHSPPPGLAFAP